MASVVTLEQLQTRALERADMTNTSFVTTSRLNEYINASARELYDLLVSSYGQNYYASSATITLSGSNGANALPGDFYQLLGVDVRDGSSGDWTNVRPFSFPDRNMKQSTSGCISDSQYMLRGNNIVFIPTPPATAQAQIWYVPALPTLTGSAETFDGVNGWEEYIVIDVAIKMLNKEESDTSVLRKEKEAIKDRITLMAATRDQANSFEIIDVYRSDWDVYA